MHAALTAQLAAGSDAGGTIDRALLAAGVPAADLPALVPPLVEAFTASHRPERLPTYPGVPEALRALAAAAPLACLTDGHPGIQAAKLAATGLGELLPVVVVTDALGGRAVRKPHPAGLLAVADALGRARRPAAGDRRPARQGRRRRRRGRRPRDPGAAGRARARPRRARGLGGDRHLPGGRRARPRACSGPPVGGGADR